MSDADDPYLSLCLRGVHLIEASAGTGKTFTLATLVTRLVVEQGLRIGQILTVTYTEAATQELRKRIRERLQLALDVFDHLDAAYEKPAQALCQHIIQTYLDAQAARDDGQGESAAALRRRLQQAVLEIDLAAIFTIHGFCARVLREHALDTDTGFAAAQLLTSDRALREDVAADVWRICAQQPDAAEDLQALWHDRHALADDLRSLLPNVTLLPAAVTLPPEPEPALQLAAQALMTAVSLHGAELHAAMLAAVIKKWLSGKSYKQVWIDDLFAKLHQWAQVGNVRQRFEHAKLNHLRIDVMQENANTAGIGKTPESPLCLAVAGYIDALAACHAWRQYRQINYLHQLRAAAQARLATLKQQRRVQTYDDLIDNVADAVQVDHSGVLVQRLREQYRVALVDEFQDTDARQWGIFKHVFGADSQAPALFLIGDPKQAIYGFRGGDVHTYLQAKHDSREAPTLTHNFRSRPAVLRALAHLYQGANNPFLDEKITITAIQPGAGRHDADYVRDNQNAPALTLWQAPDSGKFTAKGVAKAWTATASREQATAACVAAIHGVLQDASRGQATLQGQRVQPGDIAVLVRTHAEATRIQQALAVAGIPAVAAGKRSVFATDEALDLHTLLRALSQPGDDGLLRAAISTVLLGEDAASIAALDTDAAMHRQWQHHADGWRSRLARGGPLALIQQLCAQQATRLLALLDGERRLSNYLQLAECLQQTQANVLGLQGLVDWLSQQIANADKDDEAQLLRLESDAKRVQIVTLHKCKGLQYPLVFLPFVGVGTNPQDPGRNCKVRDAHAQPQLYWKSECDKAGWEAAKAAWRAEQDAERARLLYVGLTRAEHALWVATGPFFNHKKTALARLLNALPDPSNSGDIVRDHRVPSAQLPRLTLQAAPAVTPARMANRQVHSDWWVHSFSQLANADAGNNAGNDVSSAATQALPGGHDEISADIAASTSNDARKETHGNAVFDPRFAGNRFGVALHAAFEHVDFSAWQDWHAGQAAPAGQAAIIVDALRAQAYASGDIADGVALCTHLIGNTLTVALPEGVRLCDLPRHAHRAEIEFQFALRPTHVNDVLRLLHQHGIVRDRHGFGMRQQLEGLMTGLIDLTYQHAGKWYVLDYKSNQLPAYDGTALQQAMQHGEYDLQAVIYTLALHRWLRFRLGDRYAYTRDFGGIRYLFCRGIDAAQASEQGVFAHQFPVELIAALDALFGQSVNEEAA